MNSQLREQIKLTRQILEKRGSFLPSTMDEPPEEPQPPDRDRLEDDRNFDQNNLCYNIEPASNPNSPYIDVGSPLYRNENHFFRHFLDGSIRTYYWGEKLEGNRSYPIMLTEVATAAVKRGNSGQIEIGGFKRLFAILVPPSPPVSDDTWNELLQLQSNFNEQKGSINLEIARLEKSEAQISSDLRTALAAKARSLMHDLEVKLALSLLRQETEWLIVDGAIRKSSFLTLERTIGLAKSFSRMPVFSINRSKSVRDIVSLIANLQEGQRTVVFKRGKGPADVSEENEEAQIRSGVAFWYLRLRSGMGLEGPIQGVVKVDLRVKGDRMEGNDISLVNTISRALLAEKYVSPYPTPRWHAHIYPIYVAENYIKSCLYSPVLVRGLLLR